MGIPRAFQCSGQPTKIASSSWGICTPSMTWFLGPNRLISPKQHHDQFSCFVRAHHTINRHSSCFFGSWTPPKVAYSLGYLHPSLIHGYLDPTTQLIKWCLSRFSNFCMDHEHDQQTDTQTDRPHY